MAKKTEAEEFTLTLHYIPRLHYLYYLRSGCFSLGVMDLTKSCGVINTSESPCSFITFKVAKYLKILSGVE